MSRRRPPPTFKSISSCAFFNTFGWLSRSVIAHSIVVEVVSVPVPSRFFNPDKRKKIYQRWKESMIIKDTSLSTMLPRKLTRINIRIRSIIIIIYLTHFFHLLNILTYIYHYLVTINFILHDLHIYSIFIFDIYLVGIFLCELLFLSLPLYTNMVTHIVVSILYKK